MAFLGNIINFLAVVIFGLLGTLLKRGVPERITKGILSAVFVCVVFVGIDGALERAPDVAEGALFSAGLTKAIVMILSMAVGTAIGEIINIDKWICLLGDKLELKFAKDNDAEGNGSFARGFVSTTVVICVGAMAVNGAIMDGVGEPDILITKAVIDAITCFILASSLGVGCVFAAVPMLLYQGGISVIAFFFESFIPQATLSYLSSTGSLILILIGTNGIGATNVKTANMIPAVFMPLAITPLINLIL